MGRGPAFLSTEANSGYGSDSDIGSSISSVQGVKLSSHGVADGAPKVREGKRRFYPLSIPGAAASI